VIPNLHGLDIMYQDHFCRFSLPSPISTRRKQEITSRIDN
jgi:hypothetical protein